MTHRILELDHLASVLWVSASLDKKSRAMKEHLEGSNQRALQAVCLEQGPSAGYRVHRMKPLLVHLLVTPNTANCDAPPAGIVDCACGRFGMDAGR